MHNTWQDNILESIKDISDINFQKEAWFGVNKNIISSPDEMYNTLFDDFEFEEFLNNNNLSEVQKKIGFQLISEMESINNLDYKYLINSKEWNKVREIAKLFYDSFKLHPSKK